MADLKKRGQLEFQVERAMQAVRDLEKIAKANRGIGDASRSTSQNQKKEKSGLSGLMGAYGGVMKVAGGLAAAYGAVKVAQASMKWAEEAAKVRDLERAYQEMSARAGKDATEALNSVMEASGGVIDRVGAMTKMNRAMMMGVNADMGELVQVAKAASISTGESFDYMFDSIVTGLARQSVPILDNLGIIVKAETANEAYAASLGKSAQSLTQNERRIAFQNAALEAGIGLVEKMGGEMALVAEADAFGRMKANFKDLGTSMKTWLIGPLSWVADKLADAAGWLDEIVYQSPEEQLAKARAIVEEHSARLEGLQARLKAELAKPLSNREMEDMAQGWGAPSSEAVDHIRNQIAEVEAVIGEAQEKINAETRRRLTAEMVALEEESAKLLGNAEAQVRGAFTVSMLEDDEGMPDLYDEEWMEHQHDVILESLDKDMQAREDYYRSITEMARWHEENELMSRKEYLEGLLEDETLSAEHRMEVQRAMMSLREKEAQRALLFDRMQAASARILGNTLLAVSRTRVKTVPAVLSAIGQEAEGYLTAVAAVAAIDAVKYTYKGIAAMASGLTAMQASGFFAAAGKAALLAGSAGAAVGVLHHNIAALSSTGGAGLPDSVEDEEEAAGDRSRSYSVARTAPTTITITHNYYGNVSFGSQGESDSWAVQTALDGEAMVPVDGGTA